MGLTCVILQPSYIPWRGYFHQIQRADVFVFYDDVQYDHHGWRNRNRIKTRNGPTWLSIPVMKKGCHRHSVPLNLMRVDGQQPWQAKHWKTIRQSYNRAPFFPEYALALEPFYRHPVESLADFTIDLTLSLCGLLGIRSTRFVRSSDLGVGGGRTERLVAILQRLGATRYLSGPSARDYLEEDRLRSEGIELEYMDYRYPDYPQLYPPFDAQVSVLDLLFMTGPRAGDFIWG